MADRGQAYPLAMRALYVGLCGGLIFLRLLPLDTLPRGWAGPDIILALTFAWTLRRPDFVPPLLVAVVFLLCDLLFQRPPGLWAALVLLGSQTLRARAPDLRDLTFSMEWLSVASTLLIMTLGYRAVLGLLVVDQAPLGLNLTQMVMTLFVYPLVVLISQSVLGVRKRAPGSLDMMRPGS